MLGILYLIFFFTLIIDTNLPHVFDVDHDELEKQTTKLKLKVSAVIVAF